MKQRFLVSIIIILVVALSYFSYVYRSSTDAFTQQMNDAKEYRTDDYHIAIAFKDDLPAVGNNTAILRLRDTKGNPIPEAKIRGQAEMAAMGSMPSMRAPVVFNEVSPGIYTAEFDLAMRGEWPLRLQISKDNTSADLSFDMATGRSGLTISGGGVSMAGEMPVNDNQTTFPSTPGVDLSLNKQGFYTVGKYLIKVALLENAKLRQGDNPLIITVQDSQNNALNNIDIRLLVTQSMTNPGAEDTPAQDNAALVTLLPSTDGRYRGTIVLPLAGDYDFAIDVSSELLGHGDLILTGQTGSSELHAATATPAGISHYTCSMHTSVRAAAPGSCPICGMDLVPVSKQQTQSGVISIDARRRQLIGVKTATAEYRELSKSITAVGRIAYDQHSASEINLKFDTWIGELKADFIGARVERGQVLFTVYSPELLSAQQEYLETRGRLASRGSDDSLLKAARSRLSLWNISSADIRALEQRGRPIEFLPIYAEKNGVVVNKSIVSGSYAKAGSTLLQLADLSTVWVEAEVYEADLSVLEKGMSATVSMQNLSDREYSAKINYIYPSVNPLTRTTRIRLILDNSEGELRPDMYTQVHFNKELGKRLWVPDEAVMIAGETRVVFVDLGSEGKIKPVLVNTGQRTKGWIEITEGLSGGEQVITSGNFLIAAEAKLKTGIAQW
ncbi:MAG: Cu(I)/Ag(I) efflux system membrane fusion protein [Zhongshania aliphaticivorans]|jgi:Cu(I)/Ag(I) efflux system membrane fusion protein